jgi:hypothetical protein
VVAIHLATRQISRWRNASVGGSPSLTADGSVLGFVSGRTLRSQSTFAWTIRTDAPAGPLFKHARKVLGLPTNVDNAILSPSGAQLYAETQLGSSRGPLILNLYRTSTGSLIRQVARLGPGGQQLSLAALTLDVAARHMLAYGFLDGSLVKVFDLRTGRHLALSVPHLAIDGALGTLAW